LLLVVNFFTGLFFTDIRISVLRGCESRSKDKGIREDDASDVWIWHG